MKACFFVLTILSVAVAVARPDARLPQTSVCGVSPRPGSREIGVCYLESLKQTQMWIRVTPRWPTGEAVPADILFLALFDGDVTRPGATVAPPDWLNIQAQASPLMVRSSYAFTLTIPGAPTIDLLAPPAKVVAGHACAECGLSELRVPLDPMILLDIAHAHGLTANVFGMACDLNQADIDAIAAFARRINVFVES